MTNRNKPKRWIGALLALSLGSVPSLASAQMLWPDFPDAAQTPSITNHINPQHNDSVPLDAPVGVQELWSQSQSYSHFNPCASGPEGKYLLRQLQGAGGGNAICWPGTTRPVSCFGTMATPTAVPACSTSSPSRPPPLWIATAMCTPVTLKSSCRSPRMARCVGIQDYPADLTATSPTGPPQSPVRYEYVAHRRADHRHPGRRVHLGDGPRHGRSAGRAVRCAR